MNVVKPMLAKDADMGKLRFPMLGQPKLDGIRCLVIDGVAYSRTMKPLPNREVQAFFEDGFCDGFDGEILVGDPTAEDAYRRTTSFVMAPDKVGADWCLHVFDLWDEDDRLFGERYEALVSDVAVVRGGPVKLVPCTTILDSDDLTAYEEETVAAGHEGVILRDPQSLYKHGRSGKTGPLLKVKRFVDFEAVVIGVYEELHNGNEATRDAFGRTERSTVKANKIGKGTLGGLILRTVESEGGPPAGIEFRCGTGFDAAQRRLYWVGPRDGLNGRIAKIKSFPVGVKDKPRHPVFLGWREQA